jgi:hypothetical protein
MKNQLKMFVKILLPAAALAGSAAAQEIAMFPGAFGGARVHCPGPVILQPMSLVLDLGHLAMPIPVLPANPLLPMPRIAPLTPEIMPMMPARPVLPIMPVRYAALSKALAAPAKAEPAQADAPGNKLGEFFDGRSAPVAPSRRINFPERDLEAEIGAY